MNESSGRPHLNPSPNTRDVLRALIGLIALHEKRTFALATQVAALQTFLRIDLPILLGSVFTKSISGQAIEQRYDEPTDEAAEVAIEQHYEEARKRILRLRSRIESELDSHIVTAMSHDESESARQTIDLLERFLLDSDHNS